MVVTPRRPKFAIHGDPTPMVLRREHGGQVSRVRLADAPGHAAAMLKTAGWISAERPDLSWLARRRLGRALRRLAKAYAEDGGDMLPVLRLSRQAIRAWPWDPQSYGSAIMAYLRGLVHKTEGPEDPDSLVF